MDETLVAQQQDALRPVRQFVSMLSNAFSAYDQTYYGADAGAYNVPRGYQVIGPYGVSAEGLPISTTQGGGIVISPMVVLIGIGFAAAMLWKR